MGHNMVKSSSPNTPSTWLIFLCPHTHASLQKLPPFWLKCSHCSHQLLRYHSVCVQKTLIYQLYFTVFMFVTRISRYIQHSVLSAVSSNSSRSWNVLPEDMRAHLYCLPNAWCFKDSCYLTDMNLWQFLFLKLKINRSPLLVWCWETIFTALHT
jgi:hypothetical protein